MDSFEIGLSVKCDDKKLDYFKLIHLPFLKCLLFSFFIDLAAFGFFYFRKNCWKPKHVRLADYSLHNFINIFWGQRPFFVIFRLFSSLSLQNKFYKNFYYYLYNVICFQFLQKNGY